MVHACWYVHHAAGAWREVSAAASGDPMTTAAAIDRVVHHSVILELNVKSYRAQAAHQRTRSARAAKDAKADAS